MAASRGGGSGADRDDHQGSNTRHRAGTGRRGQGDADGSGGAAAGRVPACAAALSPLHDARAARDAPWECRPAVESGAPRRRAEQVVQLIRVHYGGPATGAGQRFGPTLAAEHLWTEHGVLIPVPTLRRWMVAADLWSRQRRARPVHVRRQRRAAFGELLQLDGSFHDWFEGRGPRPCLMSLIDCAIAGSEGADRAQSRHKSGSACQEDALATDRHQRRGQCVPGRGVFGGPQSAIRGAPRDWGRCPHAASPNAQPGRRLLLGGGPSLGQGLGRAVSQSRLASHANACCAASRRSGNARPRAGRSNRPNPHRRGLAVERAGARARLDPDWHGDPPHRDRSCRRGPTNRHSCAGRIHPERQATECRANGHPNALEQPSNEHPYHHTEPPAHT